jgi:gas vesicle protein
MYTTDDSMTEMNNAARSMGGFTAGLLCGAALGAAIGLLLAPSSGRQLRQDLGAKADRWRRQARDTYERASGAVEDLVSRGREAVDETTGAMKDAMNETSNGMANAGREL